MRILILLLFLVGCSTEAELRKVQPPKVVTKVVTEYRDLPSWATEQVPNKPPADGSVDALKNANNDRADTLDYVNCRSRLLAKVDKGEPVNVKDCKKP